MQPITKEEQFFEFTINKLVKEQNNTNELLQQILDRLPVKEVEKVDTKRYDSVSKRKR
jgi:hypothetical protein